MISRLRAGCPTSLCKPSFLALLALSELPLVLFALQVNAHSSYALTSLSSVYHFVPNDDFPRAASQLAPVLKNIKPFSVNLNKLNFYNQKLGATVYAQPETAVCSSESGAQRFRLLTDVSFSVA